MAVVAMALGAGCADHEQWDGVVVVKYRCQHLLWHVYKCFVMLVDTLLKSLQDIVVRTIPKNKVKLLVALIRLAVLLTF